MLAGTGGGLGGAAGEASGFIDGGSDSVSRDGATTGLCEILGGNKLTRILDACCGSKMCCTWIIGN